MLTKSFVNSLEFVLKDALRFAIKFPPIGTNPKEIKIDELLLSLERSCADREARPPI
jgi:hypothetical protein